MLKIAPDSKWYMSYGEGATNMVLNKNGTKMQVDQSYSKFHNTAVAYDADENGANIYAVATNTDRINDWSAKFSFYSREKGTGWKRKNSSIEAGFGDHSYQFSWTGKSRLEQVYNKDITPKVYDINRVPRPKMAVRGNTAQAEVYMCYFDANHSKIPVKFRYGTVNSSNVFSGSIKDKATDPNGEKDDNILKNEPNNSVSGFHTIADSTTPHKGGLYTAVGIVPKDKAGTTKDVAVVAWYDATAKNLVYSYNEQPDEVNATTASTKWQTNARVIDNDSTSGWYVDLTVDEKGGIHIAYYNNKNSELRYIYLSKYDVPTVASAQVKKVTVDSYQSVGTQVTVSTRKETISGNERIVPYISYYQAAFYNSPNSVRVAWRTDFSGDVKNGAENDLFTGAWEAMTIPVQDGTVPQDYYCIP